MKNNLLITPVSTRKEIITVTELAKTIWQEHYTPIIGIEQVDYMLAKFQSAEAITGQLKEGYLYFLLSRNQSPLGYLGVLPKNEEKELFLSKFYVIKSERGKGYGKRAMQFLESLSREHGLNKITLTVNKNNTKTINAYLRFGFKNLGHIVQNIGNGFVMDDYKMEKSISNQPSSSA